jgi:Tfp pilus assembly protein PilF
VPQSINMSSTLEKRVVIFCLLLAAATLAFYNPVVHNNFVDFDDLSYIQKNNHVLAGATWDTVKWAFTTFRDGNWHPLTWLSHALDCQFFSLNPIGHHYTSLLLHTASVVLLFLLLQQTTGFTWSSLIVAALFALHPINVESVAWAAERKNVLSMFFFLLALFVYDRYGRTGKRYLDWLVTLLFALGLLAKSQIVTFPFVLLLWDYWPLHRIGRAKGSELGATEPGSTATPTPRSLTYLILEKLPLFVLAAADSIVTVLAQRAGASVRTLAEVPLSVRMENVFVSYVRYLGKAFWPSHLVPMYPRPENLLPTWQVMGAIALLLLISAIVLRSRHNRPYLAVGWFWFLGTLVPMIGIITVGEQAMADRYAYIPYIGLFIAVVWTLGAAVSKLRIPNAWPAATAVVVVLVLGCLTYRQIAYWHDNETLWRYTLSVTDRNYVAHNNLALALAKHGQPDEAIYHFRTAKTLHSYSNDQIVALCWYELHVEHPQEAIEDCNSVLHSPYISNDFKAQAGAWSGLGQADLQLHRYDEAAENFRKALRLNPEEGNALVGTGLLALHQGQFDIAVTQLFHAVTVDSTDANALLFADALRRDGRLAEADSALAQVHKVASDLAQTQSNAEQLLSFAGLKPLPEDIAQTR